MIFTIAYTISNVNCRRKHPSKKTIGTSNARPSFRAYDACSTRSYPASDSVNIELLLVQRRIRLNDDRLLCELFHLVQ